MLRPGARVLTTVLAAAVAIPWSGPVHAAPGAKSSGQSKENYPAAVLGIEALKSKNSSAAATLTRALRGAFAARGLTGGAEVSLPELRLALGCEDNEPTCLAAGGPTLLTDRLIYGTLNEFEGALWVDLAVLEVPTAKVTSQVQAKLAVSDFVPGSVDETAERLASRLVPEERLAEAGDESEPPPAFEDAPPPPPPPPPVVRTLTADEPEAQPYGGDGLIARPVRKYKWAGLAVGLSLAVTGLVMATVTGALLRGRLRDDVFDAAEASLEDCIDPSNPMNVVACESLGDERNQINDVDPNMEGDLCEAGRSSTDALGNPIPDPAVRNLGVAEACDRADVASSINVSGIAILGIGLVTTAVFTTLLFFPLRESRKKAARLRRRAPTVGFGPTPGGGVVSGSFRF